MGGLFIFEKISTGKYQKGLLSGQEIDISNSDVNKDGFDFSNKSIDTILDKEKEGNTVSDFNEKIEE